MLTRFQFFLHCFFQFTRVMNLAGNSNCSWSIGFSEEEHQNPKVKISIPIQRNQISSTQLSRYYGDRLPPFEMLVKCLFPSPLLPSPRLTSQSCGQGSLDLYFDCKGKRILFVCQYSDSHTKVLSLFICSLSRTQYHAGPAKILSMVLLKQGEREREQEKA